MNELLFTTNWPNGSANSRVIEYCKANKIDFRYNCFNQLEININGWLVMDYKYNKDTDVLSIYKIKESSN